jgi:hypothetical protein
MANHTLLVCMCFIEFSLINSISLSVAYASHVELPDGYYSLMSEVEERGSNAELHFVEVNQDTEEPQTSVAHEGKHQSVNLSLFEIMQLPMYVCAFTFKS